MNKPKIPITRQNKFFDDKEFELELDYARDFYEGDLNFTVILYRVDRELSATDDLYAESRVNEIRYKTPVELNVFPLLNLPENKTYNKDGSMRYLQDGTLEFGVFNEHLKELNVDIAYGDYLGYVINENQIRYYTVVNDGLKNYDNKHTIFGYKSAYRSIIAVPLENDNEFKV